MALLEQGFAVRGTLRDLERVDEVRSVINRPYAELEFCFADLEADEGWEQATFGCTYVLHVASPFPAEQPDDPDELIIPARDGALRVLKAARFADVKRVVMTSSIAAIMGEPTKPKGYVYDESDWTDTSHPSVTPYEKSKTIAEKAAWNEAKRYGSPELVTILPGAVLGPLLSRDYSPSADLVRLLLNRAMPACPRVAFNCVDVRDVAAAHVTAMITPNANGQRYVCAIDPIWLKEVARILDQNLKAEGWKVPTYALPDLVVKIGAFFDPTLKRISGSLGRSHQVDNSKIVDELAISLRSNRTMIVEMAHSLIELGLVEK
ncbi:MAG: NAD-dependent epimerase/dehydratase family protein [Pseudomonadota bacterium]